VFFLLLLPLLPILLLPNLRLYKANFKRCLLYVVDSGLIVAKEEEEAR